ncbi:2-succinyl-6-hydroxy-2,4-cyclohexadiene-1-carboxylate synthase [uncultured archaeon]|nr:2-succinyl-6-hydroxy-2,4-cyclohexadiene-1-carboxylate synthase [uncultured archaeon]
MTFMVITMTKKRPAKKRPAARKAKPAKRAGKPAARRPAAKTPRKKAERIQKITEAIKTKVMNMEKGPEPIPQVPRKEIDLFTSDGVHIKADFYDDMKTEKGVILLPMLGRTKDTLSDLASSLHPAGYKCLALDPRGHGRSQMNWQSFTSHDLNNTANDIRAAKDYLSAHGSKKVSIIGASIGANLALNYAVTDSEVRTVVMLSPGLDYRGVKTNLTAQEMRRPFLIIVSKEDDYSYKSALQIDRLSGSEDTRLDVHEGLGHGTEMFKDRKLLKTIREWLDAHVL